jgi:hypothetical protein
MPEMLPACQYVRQRQEGLALPETIATQAIHSQSMARSMLKIVSRGTGLKVHVATSRPLSGRKKYRGVDGTCGKGEKVAQWAG